MTSRAMPAGPSAPLRFEKEWEAVVAGWPAPDPLSIDEDGRSLRVETRSGVVTVDARTGSVGPPSDPASPSPTSPVPADPSRAGGAALSPAAPSSVASPPEWVRRLPLALRDGSLVTGPAGLVAVLGRDGTIEARDARRGHLVWRRVAGSRVSGPGVSLAGALLIAPDAAPALQAFRWSDGAPAGSHALDPPGARLAGGLHLAGDRLYAAATLSPRPEARVICLRVAGGPVLPAQTERGGTAVPPR